MSEGLSRGRSACLKDTREVCVRHSSQKQDDMLEHQSQLDSEVTGLNLNHGAQIRNELFWAVEKKRDPLPVSGTAGMCTHIHEGSIV